MADLARFEMLQSREDVAQTKDHQALNFSDGIKAQTKSARALAEAAQVNFVVNEYPIYAKINGEEVEAPDRKALVRGDNGYYLASVRKSYGIIQPEAMWEMADTIQKVDGSWQTGQAGSSGGGKRIWMQLRAPDRDVGGQRVAGYLTLGNSFDCTLTFAAGFSNVWAVCCNTLAAALAQAKNQLQLRHTKNAPERIAEVQEVLQLARDYNRVVDGEVLKLMSTKFTMQQVWGLAAKLWPAKDEAKLPEPTRVARETFVYDYRKAPGAVEGTAFGALQAVTYYGSHRWVVRGTGKEAELLRAESNWWGRSQEFQQKAWNVLVNPDARKELETAKVYQLA